MSNIFSGNIVSPLEQFHVFSIANFFTHISFTMFIIILFIVILLELNQISFNFSIFDFLMQSTVSIQKTTLTENLNITKLIYFPLNYMLFMFILIANVAGMIPYGYTITSSFIIVLFLSMGVMVGITLIGCVEHGGKFVSFFVPSGTSYLMLPLLVIIELISYFARVLSLAIRLFANMLSGHVLLKILAGVIWSLLGFPYFYLLVAFCLVAPVCIFFIITGLEIVIACLQAYVFTVLVVIYLNDVINLH